MQFNLKASTAQGIQFIDIRHSNLCNLSCRTCGPHASSTWAAELGETTHITKQELSEYLDVITMDSVYDMYFTGGEPLLIADHWAILDQLIATNQSKNVSLRYNSNLTVLGYKDKTVFDYWKHFKFVKFQISIDAVGDKLNSLRSGANWDKIENNINQLIEYRDLANNITLTISLTLSNLNIWFLVELLEYFNKLEIQVEITILDFPDYFSLSCMSSDLISLALNQIDQAMLVTKENHNVLMYARTLIQHNSNQHLFMNTLANILLLDKLRGEKLFEYLPMKQVAINQIINNNG
jgi:sulfatase maturation enzyme AslB (radical SAM superfamily)